MITSNTVFILGAGASMPYGFPSGLELRNRLCMAINGESSELAQTLANLASFDYRQTARFAQAFRDSNLASIDAFLSRRNEFVEIGKAAIAATLCKCERSDNFYASGIDDHWYFALWNAMVADIHSAGDLSANQIKIVSFNYDRSLEYFLYSSIKNTFSLSDAEAKGILSNIQIKHVYGQLGPFGLREDHRPYTQEIDGHSLRSAANGIRIIPEAREDDDVFREVKDWFDTASNICFLGFGFDPLNISRLGLRQVLEAQQAAKAYEVPAVWTSGYGMTGAELNIAKERIIGRAERAPWFPQADKKSLAALRETRLLI